MSEVSRRRLLQLLVWTGAAAGCAVQSATRRWPLLRLHPASGATAEQRQVVLPEQTFEGGPTPAGLLFSGVSSLFTLDPRNGASQAVAGPNEGVWLDSQRLVGGEKTTADDYRVSFFRLPSTRPVWQQTLAGGELLGSCDGRVFLCSSSGVSAFELDSGKPLWQRTELRDLDSWLLTGGALLLSRGNDGVVHWIDPGSGRSLRSEPTNSKGMRVVALAASPRGTVFALTRRVGLFAFAPAGSGAAWRRPVSAEVNSGEFPVCSDDVVVLRTSEALAALDAATGRPLWLPRGAGAMAVAGTTLLVCRMHYSLEGGSTATLLGHELRSGRLLWSRPWKEEPQALTALDGSFYVLG